MNYPALNYPPIRLRARRTKDGRTEVFDAVRGRWLVLTPEEWVRRHIVEYMLSACGFQLQQIVEEYPVNINGQPQRADIVAFGCDASPCVVVECKEPSVKLDYEVMCQVVRYNSVLGCRYIVITNGLQTYCYRRSDDGEYSPIDHFPYAQR